MSTLVFSYGTTSKSQRFYFLTTIELETRHQLSCTLLHWIEHSPWGFFDMCRPLLTQSWVHDYLSWWNRCSIIWKGSALLTCSSFQRLNWIREGDPAWQGHFKGSPCLCAIQVWSSNMDHMSSESCIWGIIFSCGGLKDHISMLSFFNTSFGWLRWLAKLCACDANSLKHTTHLAQNIHVTGLYVHCPYHLDLIYYKQSNLSTRILVENMGLNVERLNNRLFGRSGWEPQFYLTRGSA